MTLKEIADALVEGCRTGQEDANLDKLYAPDAVSVESQDAPGMGREVKGVEAIRGKHAWWNANFEVHSTSADGPFLHGDDRFGVIFEIDATDKSRGERFKMKELGIYHVADGKIVREEFFY
ncbi:MAG: nuclear transport factor 2 family protein [Paracoccaceae bacterium]|nr:nuclear transport factor 2 family protein [Paracoccaceae bacterium]